MIYLRTPVSKTIGGIFFGLFALVILLGHGEWSFGRVVIFLLWAGLAVKLLVSAVRHQEYLEEVRKTSMGEVKQMFMEEAKRNPEKK